MAHIIIVDDDEIVRDLVRETFQEHGHVVGCLESGSAALRVLSVKTPDLVILDCAMPNMGGIQTLRQIRSSPRYYRTPVLMLSGRRSKADIEIAMRVGADGYVRKPFDPQQLVLRAEDVIRQKRAGYSRPESVLQLERAYG